MGYALAEAAYARGADVVLVSGPTELPPPGGVATHRVETTADMQRAVQALMKDAEIEIPVQINGKLRGTVIVPAGSDQAALVAAAHADERIAGLLAGKEIVKTIPVKGKLVNFVVK